MERAIWAHLRLPIFSIISILIHFFRLDTLTSPNYRDPGVSLIAPGTSTGLTLSGIVTNCVTCGNAAQVPRNLDQNFLRDVQAQLLVGRNNNSSIAFADDAKLPEYWANIAQGNGSLGGSPG